MIRIKQEYNLKTALDVLGQIPEFNRNFRLAQLEARMTWDFVVLIAYAEDIPIGCKIGYNRYNDGSFYSWLGGVHTEFRNRGVAQMLNTEMEKLAREKGYSSILFKTRNRFKAMLQFGLKNGYDIVDFQKKEHISEHRIILKKQL